MTITHQSWCRIEHRLQTIHQTSCDAVEFDAVVVQTRQNHRWDERHQNALRDGATDAANVTQGCKAAGNGPRHMGFHGHVTVDVSRGRGRTFVVWCRRRRHAARHFWDACAAGERKRTKVLLFLLCSAVDSWTTLGWKLFIFQNLRL